MKKFLFGFIFGIITVCFSLWFMGCGHHHKYYATHTIEKLPAPAPAPAPDVNVTVDVAPVTSEIVPTLPCECWPPGHCKGKWHHWKHRHDDDCDYDCDEEYEEENEECDDY